MFHLELKITICLSDLVLNLLDQYYLFEKRASIFYKLYIFNLNSSYTVFVHNVLRTARKTLYATVKIKNEDLGSLLNFFEKRILIKHLRLKFTREEDIYFFGAREVAKTFPLSVLTIRNVFA